MFKPEVYAERRKKLKKLMGSGILFFPGNGYSPMNYPSNTYPFRQDSSFLYFFGLDQPDLSAVIDVDNDSEILFGTDFSIDDIIWMGPQPKLAERAAQCGVKKTGTPDELQGMMKKHKTGIHYLPPYRGETLIQLSELFNTSIGEVKSGFSEKLIKSVVALREIKDEHEIAEIEKAVDTAYEMHTAIMKKIRPGMIERELSGMIEGISLSGGGPVSFPVILSKRGETLHNHFHGNILNEGDLVVTDAGAETTMHYASDITRTVPVSGKFTPKQQEIYSLVVKANVEALKMSRPGIPYLEVHEKATEIIARGLTECGIMKGNPAEAVKQGAHALFMPHGLGHAMGLDVHDMEGFGEDYVGYDEEIQRSKLFGTANLRFGKRLKEGMVMTNEPGIYFIPALIDQWRSEKKHAGFINYEKLDDYRTFGGIRIEDDILITKDGCRVLGKPVPKTVIEVEDLMYAHRASS